MGALEQSLGWTRDVISAYAAFALILMAFLFPIVGAIVDRFGARGVLVAGLCALSVCMAILSFMTAPWHLGVAYSVVGGLAFTLVGNAVVTVMIARAFDARRGLATGIATSGSTGGQLFSVPLLTLGIGVIGWRASFGIAAVLCALLALATFVLMRGESHVSRAESTRGGTGFLRDPGFHALAASFFVCGITTTGLIETHFLPFAAACGFPPMPSAFAFSLLAACNLGGMMLCGWLCDRVNRSYILAVIYAVRAVMLVFLVFIGSDFRLLIVFAIVFGAFEFATLPATAGLTATRYGVPVLGKAMGFLMTAHSLGAALGAYTGGRVFVVLGSYDAAWIGSALAALVAAFLVFFAKDPRHTPGRSVRHASGVEHAHGKG